MIHWSPPGYRNTVFLHASHPPGHRNIGFSRINCPTSLRGNSPPGMLKRRANLVSRGHFIRENTQKACTRSALEAENPYSERLLGFTKGYRRHAKKRVPLRQFASFRACWQFYTCFHVESGCVFSRIFTYRTATFARKAKGSKRNTCVLTKRNFYTIKHIRR